LPSYRKFGLLYFGGSTDLSNIGSIGFDQLILAAQYLSFPEVSMIFYNAVKHFSTPRGLFLRILICSIKDTSNFR
jgi:hypothetical protein